MMAKAIVNYRMFGTTADGGTADMMMQISQWQKI